MPSYKDRIHQSRSRLERASSRESPQMTVDPIIQQQLDSQLLSNPAHLLEQFRMLEPHNPEAIQKYGWSQIQPI